MMIGTQLPAAGRAGGQLSGNFVARHLQRRASTNPAQPLLTWYGADGARSELSAKTLANWVDKSANLFTSMDLPEHPSVGLSLLRTDPLHWATAVWALAAWQAGGAVLVDAAVVDAAVVDAAFVDAALPDSVQQDSSAEPSCDVLIVGPQAAHPAVNVPTIACSLHPLGLGFAQPPEGVVDAADALSEPDAHLPTDPPSAASLFYQHGDRSPVSWTQAAQLAPSDARIALSATDFEHDADQDAVDSCWTLLESLLAALLGAGSIVLLGDEFSPQRRREIVDQEKAIAVVR